MSVFIQPSGPTTPTGQPTRKYRVASYPPRLVPLSYAQLDHRELDCARIPHNLWGSAHRGRSAGGLFEESCLAPPG